MFLITHEEFSELCMGFLIVFDNYGLFLSEITENKIVVFDNPTYGYLPYPPNFLPWIFSCSHTQLVQPIEVVHHDPPENDWV